jgi:hypothetical protein
MCVCVYVCMCVSVCKFVYVRVCVLAHLGSPVRVLRYVLFPCLHVNRSTHGCVLYNAVHFPGHGHAHIHGDEEEDAQGEEDIAAQIAELPTHTFRKVMERPMLAFL